MLNTYSLNFGEHTMATASGSSFWYGQWVCWSTLDRKAVCVGCVCTDVHKHYQYCWSYVQWFNYNFWGPETMKSMVPTP